MDPNRANLRPTRILWLAIFVVCGCDAIERHTRDVKQRWNLDEKTKAEKKGHREEWDSTRTFRQHGQYKEGQRDGWWQSFLGETAESEALYEDGRLVAKRTFEGVDRDRAIQEAAKRKTNRMAGITLAMRRSWDWSHWLVVGAVLIGLVLGLIWILSRTLSTKEEA